MKKSIIIVSILIIILVIFGGLSYLFTGRIIPSSSCGNDFNNQFSQAVANNNLNFCSSFNGHVSYSKEPFYGTYYCRTPQIGKNLNNFSIEKNDLKNSCLADMAVVENNIEACKSMDGDGSSGLKLNCILAVKTDTGNKDYCNLITNDDVVKAHCLIGNDTNASSTISICNTITSESAKDACIVSFSQRVGNKEYCNLVTDPELKDFCLK